MFRYGSHLLPISTTRFLFIFPCGIWQSQLVTRFYTEYLLDSLVFCFWLQVGLYTWMIPLYVLRHRPRIWGHWDIDLFVFLDGSDLFLLFFLVSIFCRIEHGARLVRMVGVWLGCHTLTLIPFVRHITASHSTDGASDWIHEDTG